MKGMTDMLETLVKFSNKYGREHEYVLAGGGNTSCKTEDTLYIKGSGTSLAKITADGFVKMDRAALEKIWTKAYSDNQAEREAEVLSDMMAAKLPGEEAKRPLKHCSTTCSRRSTCSTFIPAQSTPSPAHRTARLTWKSCSRTQYG